MAKIISTPDSSCIFMRNPIVYEVTPAVVNTADCAFHRVKMRLNISNYHFELSQPVDKNIRTVEFDISSCFVTASNIFVYEPVTVSEVRYPLFTAKDIVVEDEWVENGVVRTGGAASAENRSAIMGGYTDYERLGDFLTPTLSRKPASGELVCAGDNVVYGFMDGMIPCSRLTQILPGASGTVSVNGRSVYVVPYNRKSVQFQFVNSRGCIETIRAWNVSSEKMNSSVTNVKLSRFERFGSFSRSYSRKQLKPSEFAMTSGFVNYEWARWWAYEFCMSESCWMLHDGCWIPCSVKVDESYSVIDRSKTELNHVDFTVTPDVNGAIW